MKWKQQFSEMHRWKETLFHMDVLQFRADELAIGMRRI